MKSMIKNHAARVALKNWQSVDEIKELSTKFLLSFMSI